MEESSGLRVGEGDRRLTRVLLGFWPPARAPVWAVLVPWAYTGFIFLLKPCELFSELL